MKAAPACGRPPKQASAAATTSAAHPSQRNGPACSMRVATGTASSATMTLFRPSTRPMKPSPSPRSEPKSGETNAIRPMLNGKTKAMAAKPSSALSRNTEMRFL